MNSLNTIGDGGAPGDAAAKARQARTSTKRRWLDGYIAAMLMASPTSDNDSAPRTAPHETRLQPAALDQPRRRGAVSALRQTQGGRLRRRRAADLRGRCRPLQNR